MSRRQQRTMSAHRGQGHRRRRPGFSLIEMMVASACFLFAFAGITRAMNVLLDVQFHLHKLNDAIHVAEYAMEDLLIAFPDDPELEPGNLYERCYNAAGNPLAVCPGVPEFRVTWSTTANDPVAGSRSINLSVSWLERTRQRRLSLSTYRN